MNGIIYSDNFPVALHILGYGAREYVEASFIYLKTLGYTSLEYKNSNAWSALTQTFTNLLGAKSVELVPVDVAMKLGSHKYKAKEWRVIDASETNEVYRYTVPLIACLSDISISQPITQHLSAEEIYDACFNYYNSLNERDIENRLKAYQYAIGVLKRQLRITKDDEKRISLLQDEISVLEDSLKVKASKEESKKESERKDPYGVAYSIFKKMSAGTSMEQGSESLPDDREKVYINASKSLKYQLQGLGDLHENRERIVKKLKK